MSILLSPASYYKSNGIDLTAKKSSVDIGKSPRGHFVTTNNSSFNFNNRRASESLHTTPNNLEVKGNKAFTLRKATVALED